MTKPMLVTRRRHPDVTAADQPAEASPRMNRPRPRAAPPPPMLNDSERYAQISLCAYFRAERRGFAPGHMWDDWLAAEQEVAARNAHARSNRNSENET